MFISKSYFVMIVFNVTLRAKPCHVQETVTATFLYVIGGMDTSGVTFVTVHCLV